MQKVMPAFIALLLLCTTSSMAQKIAMPLQTADFQGESIDFSKNKHLKEQFKTFDIFYLEAKKIHDFLKKSTYNDALHLQLGDQYDWQLNLFENDLLSPNFRLSVATEQGVLSQAAFSNIAYRGFLDKNDGGEVRLAIAPQFIYGFVTQNGEKYFIQPLVDFLPKVSKDYFIVYPETAVIENDIHTCAAFEIEQEADKILNKPNNDHLEKSAHCDELELAFAADYSMVTDKGSVENVNNHLIAILNAVQPSYDVFEVQFVIVEFFISNCPTCDPWTTNTDGGTLLGNFRNWGQAGGFSTTYDLAELWTNRDLDGSTVGIAYLNAICGSLRYSVVQDYTSNFNSLRVVTAHELGHNFGSGHDATNSAFIMRPSVNAAATEFSPDSQTAINNHLSTRTCLAACTDCPAVSGLYAYDYDGFGIRLTWEYDTTNYNVRIREVGTTPWTTDVTVTAGTYSATGLFPCTAYEAEVRADCINGQYGPARVWTFGPLIPEDLTVNSVSFADADISWDAPGFNVNVRVREAGTVPWLIDITTNTSPYSLTALAPCTDYEIDIRLDCGSGVFGDSQVTNYLTSEMSIVSATPINCDEVSNEYELELVVDYFNEGNSGFTVFLDGTPYPQTYTSSPQTIIFPNLPANYLNVTVLVEDNDNTSACSDNTVYEAFHEGCFCKPIFSEDFEGCGLPAGWQNNAIGTNPNAFWEIGEGSTDNPGNLDGTCFAFFDDDFIDSNGGEVVELLSPVMDVANFEAVFLSFDYNFRTFTGTDAFTVDVFDGVQWVNVFTESTNNCGAWNCSPYPHAEIDVTPYLNANFQMRFIYDDDGDWEWYVGFDNVELCGFSTRTTCDAGFQYFASSVCIDEDYPSPVITGNLGGTFTSTPSGLGLDPTTGKIDLAASSGNIYDVMYTSAAFGSCTHVETITIADPDPAFISLNTVYCTSDAAVNLSPVTTGGIFVGEGITGTLFDPAAVSTFGTPIELIHHVTVNGCTNTETQTTTVHQADDAGFAPLNAQYCIDDAPVNLVANTAGGTFNGEGVSGTTFDPATVTNLGTPIQIGYLVTAANGCVSSTAQSVTVFDFPDPDFTVLNATYCINDAALNLIANTTGGTFTGEGISGTTFDPTTVTTLGTPIAITYDVILNGCANSSTQMITVNDIPDASFNALSLTYWDTDAAETLVPTTSGGTFTGEGVSGTTFDPAAVNAPVLGLPFDIVYDITNAANCANTSTQSLTVFACQAPSNLIATTINASDATVTWDAVPNATDYVLQYRESGTTTWTIENVSGTSFFIENLSNCTAYEIEVATQCGTTTSAFSTTYNFTTANCFQVVEIQVFLEGVYDVAIGEMHTALNTGTVLPLLQPYGQQPWGYQGAESFPNAGTIPADAVDWVLIEARDGNNSMNVIETHAALLHADGSVIDVDGTLASGVKFFNLVVGESYYIVVRHRNHLDIMSNTSTVLPNVGNPYNFTDAATKALGTSQLKEIDTGVFGMNAGDIDGDGIHSVTDYNTYVGQAAFLNGYFNADLNLEQNVTTADFNLFLPNSSLIGVIEIRY